MKINRMWRACIYALILFVGIGSQTKASAQFITFSPVEFVEASVTAYNQVQEVANTLRQIDHQIEQAKRLQERIGELDFRDVGEVLFGLDEILVTGQNVLYTAADVTGRYERLYGPDLTDEEIREMGSSAKGVTERLESMQRRIARTRNLARTIKRHYEVVANASHDLGVTRGYIEGADTQQAIAEATARAIAGVNEDAVLTRRLIIEQMNMQIERDAEALFVEKQRALRTAYTREARREIDWGDDSQMGRH